MYNIGAILPFYTIFWVGGACMGVRMIGQGNKYFFECRAWQSYAPAKGLVACFARI